MRSLSMLQPTDKAPVPPDTVKTFLIAAATPQQSAWESTGSTAVANALAAGVHLVRITGWSTAGSTMINMIVNLLSSLAAAPASGTSISSSGVNHPVIGTAMFQIPGASTGYSIRVNSSGYVFVEQWRR